MMTKADLAALEQCMKIAQKNRRWQIDNMLKENPWHTVAEFAAYCVQGDTLSLLPHEQPPCDVGEDDPGKAGDLLRRLLAAGLSRYEPDPVAALERKVQRTAAINRRIFEKGRAR